MSNDTWQSEMIKKITERLNSFNFKKYLDQYADTSKAHTEYDNEDIATREDIIKLSGKAIANRQSYHITNINDGFSTYEKLLYTLNAQEKICATTDNANIIIAFLSLIFQLNEDFLHENSEEENSCIEYEQKNNLISKCTITLLEQQNIIQHRKLLTLTTRINTIEKKEIASTKSHQSITNDISKFYEKLEQEKNSTEGLISNFNKIKEENYEKLAEAFENLKKPKLKERKTAFWITVAIGIIIISATYISAAWTNEIVDLAHTKDINILKNIPITIIILDILLIYFFRISLRNYYTARDEYIQIEIRAALCKFVQIFSKFSDTTNGGLEEFSKHIFSPLNSKVYPTPHPVDFLATITSAAKNCTNKPEKTDKAQ